VANPQCENGFIRIANELFDALMRYSPGRTEHQVLFAIIRLTYGWNKKEGKISISRLQKLTGKSRRMIIYALKNLESKNMVTIKRSRSCSPQKGGSMNDINVISFQKNYEKWVVQEMTDSYAKSLKQRRLYYKKKKSMVVQEYDGSARNCSMVVQETVKDEQVLAPIKDTLLKDNKEKEKEKKKTVANKTEKIDFDKTFFKFVNLSENKIKTYQEKFPLINIELEIKKMESYLMDNPQKKYKNYGRFITAWLIRAQDRFLRVDKIEPEEPQYEEYHPDWENE